MDTSITEAVEEFLSLNDRFIACGLQDQEHERWSLLANTIDTVALRSTAPGPDGITTRNHARARIHLNADFLAPNGVEARTLDLSPGGCAVEVSRDIRPGSDVALTIGLPAELGPIHLDGWVCWTLAGTQPGRYRIGICFAGLTARERDLLTSCVLGELAPQLAVQ
jgi:hypothetical protein